MKIKVNSTELLDALQTVNKAIHLRNTLPILATVLFDARAGSPATITSTNLDLFITRKLHHSYVAARGAICIPVKPLLELMQELAKANCDVEISADGANVFIETDFCSIKLNAFHASELPPVPVLKDAQMLVNKMENFGARLGRIIPFMSEDETRYVLNSVLLERKSNVTRLVGCDGRRLLVDELGKAVDGKDNLAIIPYEAVKIASEIFKGHCTIEQDAMGYNHIRFSDESVTLITKPVDGNYPNYRQVIPNIESGCDKVHVNRTALVSAIRVAKTVIDMEKKKAVLVSFDAENLNATVLGEFAGARAEGKCPAKADKNCQFNLNADFLLDALQACWSDSVDLFVFDKLSPLVIRDGPMIIVTMPVKRD